MYVLDHLIKRLGEGFCLAFFAVVEGNFSRSQYSRPLAINGTFDSGSLAIVDEEYRAFSASPTKSGLAIVDNLR